MTDANINNAIENNNKYMETEDIEYIDASDEESTENEEIKLNSEENKPLENFNITDEQDQKLEHINANSIKENHVQIETQEMPIKIDLHENLLTGDLTEELKKRIELYEITNLNYFWIFLATVLYTLDVFSDLILGIRYFISQDWYFAFFTLFFVIGSSIFYNLFNKTALWWKAERNKCFYVWIGPYFLLNAQPLLQFHSNYRTINKYLEHKKDSNVESQISKHKEFIQGYKKAAALKHDEALWEALPQVIIQLYILLSTYDQLELNNKLIIQLVALGTSSLGLLSTRFTYHRAFHFPRGERVSVIGGLIMAVGYSIPLVCRAICIAGAIATPPWYLHIVILLLHWAWCAQWWARNGWGPRGLNSLAEGLGLTLQPSLHNSCQCLISSVVLGIEDGLLVFIWATGGGKFYKRWPVATAVTIVDVICRTIMVFYWYNKDRFISKVIEKETQ